MEVATSTKVWGTGGPGFKSRRSDHKIKHLARQGFPENSIGKRLGINEKNFERSM
jgi:hypothetical protein